MLELGVLIVLINSICIWATAKMFGETNEKIDQLRDELRKKEGK